MADTPENEVSDSGAEAAEAPQEILSDDEKDALLAGVEAGVVGGAGDSDSAASVMPFELRPDAYINFGSFPRLQGICQQMAKRTAALWSTLLRTRVSVTADETFSAGFAAAIAKTVPPIITLRVALQPLPGNALILIDDALLTALVEAFFGFTAEEPEAESDEEGAAEPRPEPPPRPARQQFTAGELRVAELAMAQFLDTVTPSWEKLIALSPEVLAREFDPSIGSGIDAKERVIVCRFEIRVAGQTGHLRLLLPDTQVASIMDDLEGAANARRVEGDPHWRACFEHYLAETDVVTDVHVSDITLPLRQVVTLKPGDLLPIAAPERARLAIGGVERAEGSFGTSEGANAFRFERWLAADGQRR
ncbi:MAG: FliM/FliN family flagellar motor switch protein [Pseudomonadota bacterium]